MTATQLPLAFVQRHNNQQLFSDHYLNVTLPQRSEWKQRADDAQEALQRISAILASFQPSQNEAQTEKDLVRPVLEALGHTFEVQAALRTPDGTKKPDYIFYQSQDALNANKNRVLDDDALHGRAFAVGDAKYWDRPLDMTLKQAGGDQFTNKNPAYQIAFYMQHSGTEWGILTNGRLWRLYHKDTAHKQDRFYEVDLPALVQTNDPEAFLYFYAFFHRSAFEPGPLGLHALLRESAAYARGVGESLKMQVYDALKHVAQGFLDYSGNGLDTDAATLQQIYDNSLIVLYRLLFILYAEARELLPMRESTEYRDDYSLGALVREIARRKSAGLTLLSTTARYWPRLRDLFHIIDVGSPPLKVATFNGGLFDPAKHQFLDRYTVGDARLMEALDKLARVDGQFVDYRDLAERHLGTIYEGLLEYHLEAPTPQPPLPHVGEGEPRSGGGGGGWTIDLFNDRGERHRTGSYYTPDFVVQYIVDQTLRPVLDAATAGKQTDAEKIAAVLNVNVLDMSMGSGHFPVAAVEYIARYLVDLGVTPDSETTNNEQRTTDEPDLAYWKRRVAQNCIYGVDLNPLAVDLAKLSLWLATTAKGKPLSFLDHHLRCGNALVGSLTTDDRRPTTDDRKGRGKKAVVRGQSSVVQSSMLDDADFARSMSTAVDSMWLIEGTAGDTIAEVREQERLYADLRETLTRRYQKVADLATASRFGVHIDPSLWQPLVDYATGRTMAPLPKFAEWLAAAEQVAQQQRFFHYDLEFPEVFFDRHGQPLGEKAGFDAVIGNPPYVRQEQLAPLKPYLQQAYAEVYAGTADLYVYFVRQGLRVLKQGGKLAYIASNSWLRANYATPLRAFLRERATVEQLIDLGDNRVFADAPDVYPAILIAWPDMPPADYTAQVATFSRGEGVKQFETQVAQKLASVSIHDQDDSGWQLGHDQGRQLLAKLLKQKSTLNDIVGGQIYRGVTTGANDVFVIDQEMRDLLIQQDPRSQELIKPLVQGEDLRPWYQEDEGRWLIFPRRGVNIDDYPAIKEYLLAHRQRLEPGIGRKPGTYKWYEIQDSVEYYEAFDKPKIVWPDISKYPRFSWDTSGIFLGNTGYIAVSNEIWLLGYLASRCVWFIISNTANALGERAGVMRYRLIDQYIRPLPIPAAPAAEREAIGDLAMKITAEAQARYELHRRARRRIQNDLGTPDKGLNQKLSAWWELDFPQFRAEVQKVYKRDIPLKDRDDWEEWLHDRRAAHQQRTAAIVRMETELNARVYALFDLTADEIKLIEESTKYRYGEV